MYFLLKMVMFSNVILIFKGGVRIPVFQAPVEMFPKLGTVVFPKPIWNIANLKLDHETPNIRGEKKHIWVATTQLLHSGKLT